MFEFLSRRRVEFSDTDMAGVVHFARYFVFVEGAEHRMLSELGASPGSYRDARGNAYAWPRVAVSCDYLAPARFGDELDLRLTVERLGASSLTYGFDVRLGGTVLARGRVTAVYCALGEGGRLSPVPLPAEMVAAVRTPDASDASEPSEA
jgi:acyl-CoA thioester hydrolase